MAQGMIDGVWRDLGLLYPPRAILKHRNNSRHEAKADRTSVWIGRTFRPWVLLHELVHSMMDIGDGSAAGHGPVFAGLYHGLIVRYLRADSATVLSSMRGAGLEVSPGVKPPILD
jgi:hypothetical protein